MAEESLTKEEAIKRVLQSHKCVPFVSTEAFESRLKQLGYKIVPDTRTEYHRARDRKRRAIYYMKHKLAGICIDCNAPAQETNMRCKKHANRKRLTNRTP